MKKKLFMWSFALVLVISAFSFLAFKSIKAASKPNAYEPIHCVLEEKDSIDKMELYYDFNDNKVYRFSIVSTYALTDSIDIEKYEKGVSVTNAKYAGYSGKIWHDNEKMITLESYYVDLFSEEEFKEAIMMSKEELQSKNRKEIIESIVPMGDNSKYSCN